MWNLQSILERVSAGSLLFLSSGMSRVQRMQYADPALATNSLQMQGFLGRPKLPFTLFKLHSAQLMSLYVTTFGDAH